MSDRQDDLQDWPVFGVVDGYPATHAHVFAAREQSHCGVRLRRMTSPEETELPSCQACVKEAVRRSRPEGEPHG